MAPLHQALHIANVLDTLDENGVLLKGTLDKRIIKTVDELLWWTKALKTARKNTQ